MKVYALPPDTIVAEDGIVRIDMRFADEGNCAVLGRVKRAVCVRDLLDSKDAA